MSVLGVPPGGSSWPGDAWPASDDDAAESAGSEVDDDDISRQLDEELMKLRSVRDDELRGVDSDSAGEDGAGGGSASDDDEFQQLLAYQPRCSFRPVSARGKPTRTSSSLAHTAAAGPAAIAAAASQVDALAPSAAASAADLEVDEVLDFTIDGKPVMHDSMLASSSAHGHDHHGAPSARRPGTGSRSSQSRPGTASRTAQEEKTLAHGTRPHPALPLFTPAEQADHDGTDAFIEAFSNEILDLTSLIASAPTPSAEQQRLLHAGVDIAEWAKRKREEVTRETRDGQLKFEQEQAALQAKLQQRMEQLRAVVEGPRPDASGVLPEDGGQPTPTPTIAPSVGERPKTASRSDSSPLPPLAASPSPIPSPTSNPAPATTAAPFLPPLLPSVLPVLPTSLTVDKVLARHEARESALTAFAAEESAAALRRSTAFQDTTRAELDVRLKESAYRQAEQARWTKKEEKRLKEIKAKKLARVAELQERESTRKATADRMRERADMRREDQRQQERTRARQTKEQRAQKLKALLVQQRELASMQEEDRRASAIFRVKQAAALEARRQRERKEAAERAERDRLESIRLARAKEKADADAAEAAEYARRKRAEAEQEAEKERLRRQYEMEQLAAKEALLRQRLEAERLEAARIAEEAAKRRAEEEAAERARQEAIARELQRRQDEELERKAYFEQMKREKEEREREEAIRAARERKEQEAREARERQERDEREAREKAERKAREAKHKKESKAARLLQRVWRGARVRREDPRARAVRLSRQQKQQARHAAAVGLQSLWRGFSLRRKLARIRAHAAQAGSSMLDDGDDEFDYGGLDPAFYTIESIPDFEMNLPHEAEKLLRQAANAPSIQVQKQQARERQQQQQQQQQQKQPDLHRSVSSQRTSSSSLQSLPSSSSSAAGDARLRVHSAGVASRLSASGRAGMVSNAAAATGEMAQPAHAASATQSGMRLNNFFVAAWTGGAGHTNSQPPQPAPAESGTKFPRLSTPTNGGSASPSASFFHSGSSGQPARLDTGASDASARSSVNGADRASRPEGVHPGGVVSSKAAKLAELSAAWGITDPRTLEAMLRKKAKMSKMKHAKEKQHMTADQRLHSFQKVSAGGTGASSFASSANAAHAAGEAKQRKKKKQGIPAAWFGAPTTAASATHEDDDEEEDDASEDDLVGGSERPPPFTGYRVPAGGLPVRLTNTAAAGGYAGPLSPGSSASLSSRSIPPAAASGLAAPSWMTTPSQPAVNVVQSKRR